MLVLCTTYNHAPVYAYTVIVSLYLKLFILYGIIFIVLQTYFKSVSRQFVYWDLSEMWQCNISVNYFMSGLAEHTTCRLLQSLLLQLTHSLCHQKPQNIQWFMPDRKQNWWHQILFQQYENYVLQLQRCINVWLKCSLDVGVSWCC